MTNTKSDKAILVSEWDTGGEISNEIMDETFGIENIAFINWTTDAIAYVHPESSTQKELRL